MVVVTVVGVVTLGFIVGEVTLEVGLTVELLVLVVTGLGVLVAADVFVVGLLVLPPVDVPGPGEADVVCAT